MPYEGKYNKQKEEINSLIDDLIGDDEPIDEGDFNSPDLPKRDVANIGTTNYVEVKDKASQKAQKTIKSLLKFYLDADLIENNEYIKAKQKIDEMTLASLIYQLEAGERALTTLLETIDSGELAPRMFEVLATLQKSMLDIIKSQTMYLMSAEESVKRVAHDVQRYNKSTNRMIEDDAKKQSNGGNVVRGQKDLMRQIQMGIKQSKGEDIEEGGIEDIE